MEHELAVEGLLEVLDSVDSAYVALVDDDYTVTDLADLAEDMRTEDNRVILLEIADYLSYLDDLIGIETNGRFVENEKLRVADECLSKAHTLLVTL